MLFENNEALAVGDLKKYAADLELDTDAFNECLDSSAKNLKLQQTLQQAKKQVSRAHQHSHK